MEVDVWSRGRVHHCGTDAARLAVQQAHGTRRNITRGETLHVCRQLFELGENVLKAYPAAEQEEVLVLQ